MCKLGHLSTYSIGGAKLGSACAIFKSHVIHVFDDLKFDYK